MRVLGLDPGTLRTGYGIVASEGDRPVRVASGVLRLGRVPLPQRLVRLHEALVRLVETYHPDACAVEGLFHQRHARSALILGHARGVCLLAAATRGIEVVEYAPATVKRAISGHGAADKQQVAFMVAHLLGEAVEESSDASDALAVAICHLESRRLLRVYE